MNAKQAGYQEPELATGNQISVLQAIIDDANALFEAERLHYGAAKSVDYLVQNLATFTTAEASRLIAAYNSKTFRQTLNEIETVKCIREGMPF